MKSGGLGGSASLARKARSEFERRKEEGQSADLEPCPSKQSGILVRGLNQVVVTLILPDRKSTHHDAANNSRMSGANNFTNSSRRASDNASQVLQNSANFF